MIVRVIGSTEFNINAAVAAGYKVNPEDWPGEADELAEFAGRLCYRSWDRPNPTTATNQGYLANILRQGHESVLEHGSVSFYVGGVSRSLLTELTRHRHLSFSVVSQRYVRADGDYVTPPAIVENEDRVVAPGYVDLGGHFEAAMSDAEEYYNEIADALIESGVPRKQALEAARSVLPNATSTEMIVTGNHRAWRDVLKKRYHTAADAEIQQLAERLLTELRAIAPGCYQDIPGVKYGS